MGGLMRTNERLVLLSQKFADAAGAIDCVARNVLREGFVDEIFVEKIKEREAEYPTGLPMAVPLAIPHVSDGCLSSFVSVAVFAEPVIFKNMDRSGSAVNAEIMFMFGIRDPKEQLAVLRKFARAFADGEGIRGLIAAKSPAGLLVELTGMLEGMIETG
jgi:PTS system galactitol-specific IIA component